MRRLLNPEVYHRYFTVVPASTPELLHAAYALRYQAYCVEHAFENPDDHQDRREVDQYDARAVHAVVVYQPYGKVVACVRLILPQPDTGRLPLRTLLAGEAGTQLDRCDPARTAELSRYAVSRALRRRHGEELVTVSLIRGAAQLAAERGVTTVCAAMAPALHRLLARVGLVFQRLGPVVDYHGRRQPCVAECADLLAGLNRREPRWASSRC